LAVEEYASITAFILQSNGAQAGPRPLTATTTVAIGTVAAGEAGTPAPAAAARPAAPGDPDAAARTAPARPRGLTVTGEVKNYVPVTDETLRNPAPGDWLVGGRNYQAWR